MLDDLRLVEAVDCLCHRVVVAVTNAADRRIDLRFLKTLCVLDRQVLGGFNWSSQRFGLYLMLGIGPVLRLVFSNQAFSGVGCLVYKQLHPTHLGGAG